MKTLIIKEWKEQFRTGKFWILLAVFSFFAILSPVTAYYMPDIITSMSKQQNLEIKIPDPTWMDAMAQYFKNLSQICTFVVILMMMGVVVREKESGTAVFMIVKPVKRSGLILSKYFTAVFLMLIILLSAFLLSSVYTWLFFGNFPIFRFFIGNILLFLHLATIISFTVFFSTISKNQFSAALFAFLIWLLFGLLAQLGNYGIFSPSRLISESMNFLTENPASWKPVAGAFFFNSLFVFLSVSRFNKWES